MEYIQRNVKSEGLPSKDYKKCGTTLGDLCSADRREINSNPFTENLTLKKDQRILQTK